MRTWDRIAWVSSWVAPLCQALLVAALALAIAVNRGVTGIGSVATFAIAAFVSGSVGMIAHLLVVYRVHKTLRAPSGLDPVSWTP